MVQPLNDSPSSTGRPFRFSRQFRLKSPLVIRDVLKGATSSRRRWDAFRVVWAEQQTTNLTAHPNFAFVVSRDAGPAVTRNLIKRRLRESVRLLRDHWPTHPLHIVIRVNDPKVALCDFADLKKQTGAALLHIKRAVDSAPCV